MGLGGSIPFIAEFAATFPDATILVTGVQGPRHPGAQRRKPAPRRSGAGCRRRGATPRASARRCSDRRP